MTTDDRFTDDIGAYLLGALDPGEQRAFEQHLETCEECRDEVVRLEVARDSLPRGVDQVVPPDRLKAALMETVRAEAPEPAAARAPARRSRWRDRFLTRPRYAAAAAAVFIAVGIGVGAAIGALGGGEEDARTLAATVDQARMPSGEGSLAIHEDGDGTLRVEGMQQPQDGHVYEVWIQHDGRISPSSLFTVESDGTGAAAIPGNLKDADAVLVTREPEGGSKRPSERPVLTVPLSS
jgi:anti-sigma-K factor RskA